MLVKSKPIELNDWVYMLCLGRIQIFFSSIYQHYEIAGWCSHAPYTHSECCCCLCAWNRMYRVSRQASKRPIDQPNQQKKKNAIKYISEAKKNPLKPKWTNGKKTCASLRINYFTLGIQCTHKYKSLNRLSLSHHVFVVVTSYRFALYVFQFFFLFSFFLSRSQLTYVWVWAILCTHSVYTEFFYFVLYMIFIRRKWHLFAPCN